MDISDGTGRYIFILSFPNHRIDHSRSFQQSLIIFFNKTGIDLRQFFIPDDRKDIIIYERNISIIRR